MARSAASAKGLTLEESAALASGHRWVEMRLFEILGGWVATTAEVDVKLMLDRHSQHHAWRAAQWKDRLPAGSDVEIEGFVSPPAKSCEGAFAALASLEGTVARLAGAYRFALPRLATSYRRDLARSSGPGDASVNWTLGLVVRELEADWREGEVAVQGLLGDRGAVESAARAVVLLEDLLL